MKALSVAEQLYGRTVSISEYIDRCQVLWWASGRDGLLKDFPKLDPRPFHGLHSVQDVARLGTRDAPNALDAC